MSIRVILADDHRIVREGLRSLLEDLSDVEVVAEAEDGRMAVSGYPVEQRFQSGDRVLIKSGPLRDLEAVFDRSLSSSDRAKVLVDMLGRLTTCEIELDCLEKVTRKRPGRRVD